MVLLFGPESNPGLLKVRGLRLVTGAFRTSPVSSICTETGVLPHGEKRIQLILNYCANIWARKEHFLYKVLYDPACEEEYIMLRTVLGHQDEGDTGLQESTIPKVKEIKESKKEPWMLSSIPIRVDMAELKKETPPPYVFKAKFLALKEEYSEGTFIYTDGSRVSEGVGSAVCWEKYAKTIPLPKAASIFTAELTAISSALSETEHIGCNQYVICTDSLSVVLAIRNIFTMDPLIQAIQEKIRQMHEQRKEVVIAWIPGHVGIEGNENADQAAKGAAIMPHDPETPVPPPHRRRNHHKRHNT
ncbi:uncharacterized protein LOC106671035 [Cimex lectularius]|uniref:RNase H type-1 domain-containing protein n=1 Tax=Cimex lectularius TaxID=79782 RepID=A0A8I6TLM9_CIMLE|nr:uncharacterized protein LOC106671035 [Cimex lectularius]